MSRSPGPHLANPGLPLPGGISPTHVGRHLTVRLGYYTTFLQKAEHPKSSFAMRRALWNRNFEGAGFKPPGISHRKCPAQVGSVSARAADLEHFGLVLVSFAAGDASWGVESEVVRFAVTFTFYCSLQSLGASWLDLLISTTPQSKT